MRSNTTSSLRLPALRPLTACLAAALSLGAVDAAPARCASPAQDRASVFARGNRSVAAPDTTVGRVTNCNDSGAGSLRDAIALASNGGFIDLNALTCSTITLSSGAIGVPVDTLFVYGLGAGIVTIDGNGADRVFNHTGHGNLYLLGLSVRNGHGVDRGGCVYSAGTVAMSDASVSGCTVQSATKAYGGGVYAKLDLKMSNSTLGDNRASATSYSFGGGAYAGRYVFALASTVSDNHADGGRGGGLSVRGGAHIERATISGNHAFSSGGLDLGGAGGSLDLISSTVSGNAATRLGGVNAHASINVVASTIAYNQETETHAGGLFVGTHATLKSTLVAGNTSGASPGDIGGGTGASLSGFNNLIRTSRLPLPGDTLTGDPLLAPLGDNGGPTLTHALRAGSPAIDRGNLVVAPSWDQRGSGATRVAGAAADIGAYEVQSTGVNTIVGNCNNDGSGSLRDAVEHAASGDMIDLSALTCGTLHLNSALSTSLGALTLVGPGAAALTLDAGQHDRIIQHLGYGTLSISGLTLANGRNYSTTVPAQGGCISTAGVVSIASSRVVHCTAQSTLGAKGGGIFSYSGDVKLVDSVVSGNSAIGPDTSAYGGGIASQTLDMRNSTLADNIAVATTSGTYSHAGGARFSSGFISGSTISGNRSGQSGALESGNVKIIDSTISGNVTAINAAGIYAFGFLKLWNSTIAANQVTLDGSSFGAGLLLAHAADLESSIIYGNTVNAQAFDMQSDFNAGIVGSHNLIGISSFSSLPPDTRHDDPLLGPLQDNGGSTQTHALLPGSPAIDTGANPFALSFDQRGSGFARTLGGGTDIGSFEAPVIIDVIFANGFD